MSKVLVNDANLSAIAGAIREKNGEETTYKPAEMAEAIRNLPSGGGGGGDVPWVSADEWYRKLRPQHWGPMMSSKEFLLSPEGQEYNSCMHIYVDNAHKTSTVTVNCEDVVGSVLTYFRWTGEEYQEDTTPTFKGTYNHQVTIPAGWEGCIRIANPAYALIRSGHSGTSSSASFMGNEIDLCSRGWGGTADEASSVYLPCFTDATEFVNIEGIEEFQGYPCYGFIALSSSRRILPNNILYRNFQVGIRGTGGNSDNTLFVYQSDSYPVGLKHFGDSYIILYATSTSSQWKGWSPLFSRNESAQPVQKSPAPSILYGKFAMFYKSSNSNSNKFYIPSTSLFPASIVVHQQVVYADPVPMNALEPKQCQSSNINIFPPNSEIDCVALSADDWTKQIEAWKPRTFDSWYQTSLTVSLGGSSQFSSNYGSGLCLTIENLYAALVKVTDWVDGTTTPPAKKTINLGRFGTVLPQAEHQKLIDRGWTISEILL